MSVLSASPEIACRSLWKIFGPNPAQVVKQLTADQTRAQILADTGHVLAVRDVSFEVAKGETFVVMASCLRSVTVV